MQVMSCPSAANEPESCCCCCCTSSSEGSCCTSASGQTRSSSTTASSLSEASKHHAPPPPPLPPPPPPGAPPPPPPVSAGHNTRRKRRVRSFFWKPIPEEKVRGKPNIWTLAVRQQQYQIDVRSVEELFGQQEEAAMGAAVAAGAAGIPGQTQLAGVSARVSRSRSFKESSKDEISILDSKRGMNVGIFLKQFKKTNRSIVEDIRAGEGKIYGAELLKDLLKLLPDAEEIRKLQAFKGDPDKLTLVDSFMHLLIQVPRFEVRIEAMVLREEFGPSCATMSHDIDVVRVATKELMSCEELHAILHLVLQAGNIMNAGGYAGNAVGFKLPSLLSLADTKANKPGMNLLHFVALEAKKKDEKLLKFPEKLQDVQSAARISVENIELEFSSLYVRIKSLEEKVQGDEALQQQLEPFLQSSAHTLQDLKRRRMDLRREGSALIDFFCEDKDTFKLDECFRIFQDFCIKFKKAVKDNSDRELKEAARQRRLRELEEKRFAWAGVDDSGVFGRSSSENDVEMLTKEGLLDFFQQRSQSPGRPLGRSASARRHRHTMMSTADRELQGYLELFGGSAGGPGGPADCSKFNSLPRSGRAGQRRTTPWILAQDDNRELAVFDRLATSPRADTEPISPLARFSSPGLHDDPRSSNNNNVALSSCVSESSAHPCVFQKSACLPVATLTGHMNVSVEKHTLVRGPRAFELNNNGSSGNSNFVRPFDAPAADLEGREASKTAHLKLALVSPDRDKEDEDVSTVSSTTCDTPLPLDTSASNKRLAFSVPDCTETDCSVALDYSEVESSPPAKEQLFGVAEEQQRQSSLRSLEDPPADRPASTNELVASATPSAVAAAAEDWDTESCDTAEGRHGEEKGGKRAAPTRSSVYKATKSSAGRAVRTLTGSESQGLRKVVPIGKQARAGVVRRAEGREGREGEATRRGPRDQSTPAARGRGERLARPPRHSSLPPDEAKVAGRSGVGGGGLGGSGAPSRWARDPAAKKPGAKLVRNSAKAPPEEKMCRSTMRALAVLQAPAAAAATAASSDNSATSARTACDVPSFARNTVASTSRTKKEVVPPSSLQPPSSIPGTPSRSPSLRGRQTSLRQSRPPTAIPSDEERPLGAGLRRVQSVRATSRGSRRADTPPPPTAQVHEDGRKPGSSASAGRNAKPSWK